MRPLRVAVDLDEVLAKSIANLYNWHNREYGTDLVPEKDGKHFAQWLNRGFGDHNTFQKKFDTWSASEDWAQISVIQDARPALQKIKGMGYGLSIVTSRRPEQAQMTRIFMDKHFPDLFEEIWFCAEFRSEVSRAQMDKGIMGELLGEGNVDAGKLAIHWSPAAKSVVCNNIEASFLIDDSIHNAIEVANNGPGGITVVLFGRYQWNRHWTDMTHEEFTLSHQERMSRGYVDDLGLTELPENIVRCSTWSEVIEVFGWDKNGIRLADVE